ncbi:MAG: beta-lactamase family protein [Clostridiaceae bacterium]|jgi:CubicO group peptidase (beta-lactamase class C family)|nr:beta-lactamase family protein [Clostridiaceae bacterium]
MNSFANLTPLLKRFVENGPSGCSCSVVHKGEKAYEEYFGYADIETKTPVTPDTLFRIFSMTKPITCTAALILYERGLYYLNDPLYEYLPEFKNLMVYRTSPNGEISASPALSHIRIRDLFTMTSGITYNGNDTLTGRQVEEKYKELAASGTKFTIRDVSKILASIPLCFDPGTHWRYGMSHDILAAFVEVVSGKKFSQFLQDEIFSPLGMKNTFHRVPEDKKKHLCSSYYRHEDGAMQKSTDMDFLIHPDDIYDGGGSGLLSTLGDYHRFIQMLCNNGELDGVRILGRKTIDLMATNHLTDQQLTDYSWSHHAGYGYGLGVRVMIDTAKGGCNGNLGEFGWSGMLGTWMMIDRKEDLTVTYMQQLQPSLEELHAPRLRSVIYGSL